jgi:hypothetical protein
MPNESAPKSGEFTDELWNKVAALYARVSALENMTLVITSPYPTQGTLEVHENHSVLTVS